MTKNRVLRIAACIGASILFLFGVHRLRNIPETQSRKAVTKNAQTQAPVSKTSVVAPLATAKQEESNLDKRFGSSISGEANFWEYALAMRGSRDPAKLFEAQRALKACASLDDAANDIGVFMAGGKTWMQGALTPERQLAYQDLIQKCSGYRRATTSEREQVRADIRSHIELSASDLMDADRNIASAPSLEKVKTLVFSKSAAAIAIGLPALATYWASSQGINDPKDLRRDDMGTAALLAACDLGTDCSTKGYESEYQCVVSGWCDGYWSMLEANLPPERVARVNEYKAQLIAAIKGGDLRTLGFPHS